MRLREIFNIRIAASVLVACALTVSSYTVSAQVQDTAVSSISTVADTAAVSATQVSPSSAPLISTAVDTAARYKNMQPGSTEVDHSAAYKTGAYYLLLFILFCVFIAVVGKVMEVYEVSRDIQGRKGAKFDSRKFQGGLFIVFLLAGLYGVYWSYSVQGPMSMHESASEHGMDIDFMFNITLIITTIVFILTHIALFGFSYQYRGSKERKAYFYPHNNALERIWTIVPAIALTVLVLLGFFTWRSITNVSEEDQKKAMNIEVIGEQFKWNLRYSGEDNSIGKRNFKLTTPTNGLGIDFKDQKSWDDKLVGEIVIPVGKPVRVTIGSKDILHSFYLPDFRVQINAVPGMPTYFQFTPRLTTAQMREKRNNPAYDYVLLCAKICGAGHYNMQAKVTVVTEAEYAVWIAKQPLYYSDDVKKELQMAEQKSAGENKKIALNTNTTTK
ncbi:cytochrome c oxidase subunit II [Daejeonella lutea]|uniref:Cytochrome c oxidase subunit 2 n=1 Tax=Daejeonella lutea TaxID=572036 RepID=A0A1T5D0Z6_9SPHI|nr:cytochrome c oxidase subunit II [Daejeonella lutea]SKB65307.1 cytochrome c oxidase subunit 2 [Daejeonella lutea]